MASKSAPIKIIRVKNETLKDNNTIFHATTQSLDERWNRWDAIVTSIADYDRWSKVASIFGIVLTHATEEDAVRLTNGSISSNVRLFLTKQAYDVRPASVWSQVRNMQFIDDFASNYPHITPVWNGTTHDAIACIAIINRYSQIVDIDVSEQRAVGLAEAAIRIEKGAVPPQIWFVTQYFVHKNAKRAREIRKCLMNNCVNPYVDKILLLNETDLSRECEGLRGKEKIEQRVIVNRLRYCDLIQATLDWIPSNVIVAYANADIYLDDTIKHTYDIDMRDKMLALLRWNTDEQGNEPKLFGPFPDSQDTWVVLSDSVKSRTWDMSKLDYQLGRAGCDNRFTYDMFTQRFLICNPAHTIKTLHIHKTEIRDYVRTDITYSPCYIYTTASQLLDINKLTRMTKPVGETHSDGFPITIRCPTPANGVTWCTMLGRHNRFVWEHGVTKEYLKKMPVYEWTNCFTNSVGLVYNLRNVYVGGSFDTYMKDATVGMSVDYTSRKDRYDCVVAVPVNRRNVYEQIDYYILNYLSRALNLLQRNPKANIWMPPHFKDAIAAFNTGSEQLHAIACNSNTSVFANKIIGYAPDALEIGREDIQMLRKHYSGFIKECVPKTCVVLIDPTDAISPFTSAFVEDIRKVLGEEWTVTELVANAGGIPAYEALTGKEMCILFSGAKMENVWSKLWALPPRCRVIEFQNELKVDGECQHMCAAADFDTWLITLFKGRHDDMRAQAIKLFSKWWGDQAGPSPTDTSLALSL